MKTKYLFFAILFTVVFFVVWIGMDTFTQPGISDLKGEYRETARYRNENNTGPVIRRYAVYSKDTLWSEFSLYGDFMPHTKYGNTMVFFFTDLPNTPRSISPEPPYFEEQYQNACVALYEKSAMGEISFRKHPFK